MDRKKTMSLLILSSSGEEAYFSITYVYQNLSRYFFLRTLTFASGDWNILHTSGFSSKYFCKQEKFFNQGYICISFLYDKVVNTVIKSTMQLYSRFLCLYKEILSYYGCAFLFIFCFYQMRNEKDSSAIIIFTD